MKAHISIVRAISCAAMLALVSPWRAPPPPEGGKEMVRKLSRAADLLTDVKRYIQLQRGSERDPRKECTARNVQRMCSAYELLGWCDRMHTRQKELCLHCGMCAVPAPLSTAMPPAAQCDRAPSAEMTQRVSADVSSFAWSLYAQVQEASDGGNVFVSPVSVALALAMLQAGAKGNTMTQIDNALTPLMRHSQYNDQYAAFRQLMLKINSGNTAYELDTANAIYIQRDMSVLPTYSAIVAGCLQSEAKLVDFEHNARRTTDEINGWVEKRTRDKIRDLLSPEMIDEMTRMVLVNAIYFKAEWLTPFTTEYNGQTVDGYFRPTPYEQQSAKFMTRQGRYNYYEDASVQVLALPYKGGQLAMYVILPRQGTALHSIRVDGEKMRQWTGAMSSDDVNVELPKFKLTESVNLKGVLQRMGMTDMFRERAADFSAITGDRSLYVSAAVHKAFVEVNELGTEAAAATAVVWIKTSARLDKSKTFRADRPFVFVIRHEQIAAPLFVGTLARIVPGG